MKERIKYTRFSKLSKVTLLNISLMVLSSITLVLFSCMGQSKNGPNESKIKAIYRQDNDFVTFKDTLSTKENIPKIVENKILLLLKEYASKDSNNLLSEADKTNPLVFRIGYSDTVSLYIVKINFVSSLIYNIIAFDSISNQITANPPHIFGKWMENNENGFNQTGKLLVKPLISLKDINGDNKKEILVQERVHNGTIYNAVVTHYYTLDKLMNLKEILCLESKYMSILDNCIVTRSFQDNTIISYITCSDNKPELIGKAKLVFSDSVYVASKEVLLKRYENLLITGSEVSENEFLQKGYQFEY